MYIFAHDTNYIFHTEIGCHAMPDRGGSTPRRAVVETRHNSLLTSRATSAVGGCVNQMHRARNGVEHRGPCVVKVVAECKLVCCGQGRFVS